MAKSNKLVIVIPTHKTNYSDSEKISLFHLEHYLKKYDKYFAVPVRIKNKAKRKGYKVITYPNEYFTSVPKYCELLNQKYFYTPFKKYEYMLIYHLDSLVFSDIQNWLKLGFDYIGPPWFRPIIGTLTHKKGYPKTGGNGGLSLRKIQTFINIIEKAEKLATRDTKNSRTRKWWFLKAILTGKSHKIWLNAPPSCYPFNEDGFWSYEAPKYDPLYKVATFKKSLEFGFEKYPRKCFKLNNNQLPFGTHAWTKYDEEFWKLHLLKRDF